MIGGPPSVDAPLSPFRPGVPKMIGLLFASAVLGGPQLNHLNGLKKSNRICAWTRSLIGKSLYADMLAAIIRREIHSFAGTLPLVNDGAAMMQLLAKFERSEERRVGEECR